MGVNISYDNKYITCISGTNFLDLIIDEKLSWKNRIDQLLSKLSSVMHIELQKLSWYKKLLRMIYFSYVHSIMTYGIIFWGNSPYSINIFRIPKKNNQNYNKFKK